VYTLALKWYKLETGGLAFPWFLLNYQIAEDSFEYPDEFFREDIHPDVRELMKRCLAANPKNRANPDELLARLEPYLGHDGKTREKMSGTIRRFSE